MRQRERRSRRAARVRRAVTVGLLLTSVTAPTAATAADSGKERDVRLVYCLDTSHRAGLASAGVRLGLLKPGATADGAVRPTGGRAVAPMTLTAWAERREDDFGRACDALMAAGSESPGSAVPKDEDGWPAALLTQWAQLPLVVLGALLTLLVQFWDRTLGERRQFKKQLETCRQTFRSAARLYLAAYERDPKADHGELLPAREALSGAFAEVEGAGAKGRAARRLADGLPLSQRLPENSEGVPLTPDGRKHEADRIRQLMDRQLLQAADLSRTFPYWWWRALRDRPPGSGV